MTARCRSHPLLLDRIEQLERTLALEIARSGWETANVTVEFVRITSEGELFVHCEPAMGEARPAFEARYRALRETQARSLRPKLELVRGSH